jgi:hypothetical protein
VHEAVSFFIKFINKETSCEEFQSHKVLHVQLLIVKINPGYIVNAQEPFLLNPYKCPQAFASGESIA